MSATCHVPPAPPATTCLALAAALTALVAAGGAGLADAAAGPVAGVGVLAALALAVPAGWSLAARVTPAWAAETDRLAQAEARALAGWLYSAAWRVWAGAMVGWAVLFVAAGLVESGDAFVALGLATLGGVAGVAVVAVVAAACRRERDGSGERRRRLGRGRCAARATVASLTPGCPPPGPLRQGWRLWPPRPTPCAVRRRGRPLRLTPRRPRSPLCVELAGGGRDVTGSPG